MDLAGRVPICGDAMSKHTAYLGMALLLSSAVSVLSTKPNTLQAGCSRGTGPAPRLQSKVVLLHRYCKLVVVGRFGRHLGCI